MHKYQILTEIGHGAYSIVFKARDLMRNNIVAIKRINHTNPDITVVLQRQIKALQSLQHPNIIRLLEVCSDNQYAYLVFQYLPYDLITYYKEVKKIKGRNLNDEQIVYISWQMCQALGYMHQCGLMHRDIKPQNVLIDPSNLAIKLIDFGFATQVNQYGPNTQYMITRWYRPLEIVLNLPYDGKSDIFALGALLLELYLGEEVFRSASNLDQLYWIIEICGYPSGWNQAIQKMNQLGISINSNKQPQIYKLTNSLKNEAASLIISMLNTNPYKRFSIVQILNHSYFSELRQSQMKKNSIVNRSSNPLTNSYSNMILKSSTSRNTICEQNADKIQKSLANMKMKANNSSAHNLFHFSKLQKMKKGLSLQKNDHIIERYQSKILNSNNNYLSPTNKELQFKNQNGVGKQQNKQFFPTQRFNQKAIQSFTPKINHLYISDLAKQKQESRSLQRTQSYGLSKYDYTAETNQKSHQNQNSSSKYLKVGKITTDNFQRKTVRHKTQENDKEYSKQKQYEKTKEKERERDIQLIKKYGQMQGHTRSNSSLSIEKNLIEKQKQKQTKLLNELDEQTKALKFRTKSYQGISVVSLKRDNYNGFNNYNNLDNYHSNQNNMIHGYSSKLTVSSNIQKNPQKVYHSAYQTNINFGSTNSLINNANYSTNPNSSRSQAPIHNLQGNIKKKQATFTKIRDKLLIDNKPIGKIKISLTQRERNHILQRQHYMHKPYQVRNMV